MKIMDKEIRTGMELLREGVRSPSVITRIEDRIRKMLLEKFGYILTECEIRQITRRENERGKRSEESLARSQWNIMRSKERARLREKIKMDIQEGKLFKKHERIGSETLGRMSNGGEPLFGPKPKKLNIKRTVISY